MLRINRKATLFLVLPMTASVLMSGCEKKAPPHEQPTEKPAASTPATAAGTQALKPTGLITKQEAAKYTLPACDGETCPEVQIKRLETSNPWVNQFLDQQIVLFSSSVGEAAKSKKTLQQNVDDFVAASNQDAKDGGMAIPYSMNIEAKYLGQKGDVALFEISGDYFTGGAHGNALTNYYSLDLAQKKQLSLDDILVPGQKQALHDAVYAEFVKWVKSDNNNTDVAEYEKMWKFHLSDNFSLAKDGIVFLYGQYDIGPYAVGMPEFKLPYAKLQGIVKPQYLPG